MDKYQCHFSETNTAVSSLGSRTPKFEKIWSIIGNYSSIDFQNAVCLEVGCSAGIIVNLLSKHFRTAIVINIDHNAILSAHKIMNVEACLLAGDALSLPLKDKSLDVIICNHVYEHVTNSHLMMSEIYRVLKDEGFCFFSAGNKFSIIEGHYHIPFLSWLPKSIADLYLRITGKGQEYYEKHLSYYGLRKLLSNFEIEDYTIRIIKNSRLPI
ncbi:methylase involved in ubiquinone/menaquinone biosynthesis [Candidatus Methanoperedens nitroreducens]|uniref:Methylase involved in ubiquinone/menaquinone biosynthesis n=1 Tax=Candidatus Methanoperedens nitratireducens TaxID=1392998 RepID=A0A062V4C9_9EURY|nr:class I SAM-dependent methyltransferase [Candidatus Methanoperedens nitroreducens]KCZ72207.1 methylase involved in ubiquinone/menaquinone biosynthesis [Candidatus Methanoperedens nitroreducens]MDJ1421815.1 class I SAM-dependent methyltransferase [Candidatus Methanoperedens sp.]